MSRPIAFTLCLFFLAPLWAQTQSAPARPEAIPKEWKQYLAGTAFTFWGPPDLKEEKIEAIDTYLGRFTSPSMTITFNYGWNAGDANPQDKPEAVKVDGRSAYRVQADTGVSLYVPVAAETKGLPNSPAKLQISVACGRDAVPQAVLMLGSIRFLAPLPAVSK